MLLPDANNINEMNAAKLGLKFDDLGRVRVVDDETAVTTGELHGESNELLDSESKQTNSRVPKCLVSICLFVMLTIFIENNSLFYEIANIFADKNTWCRLAIFALDLRFYICRQPQFS